MPSSLLRREQYVYSRVLKTHRAPSERNVEGYTVYKHFALGGAKAIVLVLRHGPNSWRTVRDVPCDNVLLQDRGLGAEVEEVPTLKGVDGFARHHTHERGLHIELFR